MRGIDAKCGNDSGVGFEDVLDIGGKEGELLCLDRLSIADQVVAYPLGHFVREGYHS